MREVEFVPLFKVEPEASDKSPRAKAMAIARAIKGSDFEAPVPPVEHLFARGVYVRRMRIPAGLTVVGKVHKHSQVTAILAGDVSVLGENGVTRHKAGALFVSQPGVMRVAYAHEDTDFVTFHGSTETDLARLEEELVETPILEIQAKHLAAIEGEAQ